MKLTLYYDGKCPFCSKYADILKLKKCYELEILNARENKEWKKYKKDAKLDDGVILIVNNTFYQGVESLDMLLKTCQFNGTFFSIHNFIFSKPLLGNIVYTIFKFLRKVALFLKTKTI